MGELYWFCAAYSSDSGAPRPAIDSFEVREGVELVQWYFDGSVAKVT